MTADQKKHWKKTKDAINGYLFGLGKVFHEAIPLEDILAVFKLQSVTVLDDDATTLSGFMLTGKDGRASFDLKFENEPVNPRWVLAWHKMDSGRWEVTSYIS